MKKAKKILLVDDDAIIALTEAHDLKKDGYEVKTVLSGDQAVKQVQIDPDIDLILMDIDLGAGMDGTEAAEIILRDHDLPIVFLSSHTEVEVVEKTEKITSYGYVSKNSGETVLLASLKMAFKLFEANQKLKERERALEESRGKLEATLNTLPDLMFEVDQDFIISEYYASSPQRLYARPDQFLNKRLDEVIPGEASEIVSKAVSRALMHGSDFGAVYHLDFTDERRWYELSAALKKTTEVTEKKTCIVLVRDVTVRMKAELEKRESDDKYKRLIENLNDLVCEIDSVGTFLYLSPQYKTILGYEPEELLGRSAGEILDPEQIEKSSPRLAEVVENKTPSRDEWCFKHKNGSWRWLECASQAYRSSSGEERVVVISRDITDKKKADEDLRKSKALLEESQRVARVGHYVFYISQGYWTSSSTLDDIFGINQEYIKTVENWLYIIHPEHRQEMKHYLNDHVLGSKKPFDKVYKIQRIGDQKVRWVHGLGKLEMNDAGEPVVMFGVIQDITERKEVEEALLKSQESYRVLVENSNAGIFQSSLDGKFLFANQAVAQIGGYSSPGEFMRISAASLYANPLDRETFINRLKNEGVVHDFEVMSVKKDGTIIWISINAALLKENQGNPATILGFIYDVTSRKKMEQELSKTLEEKSALLRELQHRIKNTMVMIMSLISLQADGQQNKEPFNVLKCRIQSITDLYSMLYQTNNFQDVDLSVYVKSIIEGLKNWGGGANISYEGQSIQVSSKFAMSVGLIVNELTTNALKYAHVCKSGTKITVVLEAKQGQVNISVADTGGCLPAGFSMEHSAGLGLKLVMILASQYGGILSFEPGEITCFRVTSFSE